MTYNKGRYDIFVAVLRETADVCYLFFHISLGNFSMFAVLSLSSYGREWNEIIRYVINRLGSGIPHKIKFFMVPLSPISDPESSESLVLTGPYGGRYLYFGRLMLDILNKRWQTLDLMSMMEELNRSAYKSARWGAVFIIDKLSSRPRFQKEEDLTDCA